MSELRDANLIFRALIITGLILFGFFLAERYDLVSLALNADRSYISYLILCIYLLATAQWLWLSYRLSSERQEFRRLETAVAADEPPGPGSTGLLGAFLDNLNRKRDANATALLEAFGDQLLNRHALGHFLSDVLLKLGLLGTIVGFILMLMPMGEIREFDPSLMQRLLSSMSGGMAVALYTTLAGLITSTLLKMQYHLLDASAAELVTRLAVLVDVRLQHGAP
ncbi:MAG: MotA/TolQ/ExbB proton channel family protein [Pseudomonadales bacterium]|nr:MotA/TolQ/ExbB proton channel family protein [Pseudomonadales bacterium]